MTQIACHECDLLLNLPEIEEGQRAYCPRCNHMLCSNPLNGIERALAYLHEPAVWDSVSYGQDSGYPPFPLIYDMILADDIKLLEIAREAQTKSQPLQVKDLLMSILVEYPHTDIGKAISKVFEEIIRHNEFGLETFLTPAFVNDLWLTYRRQFKNNAVIDQQIFTDVVQKYALKQITKK